MKVTITQREFHIVEFERSIEVDIDVTSDICSLSDDNAISYTLNDLLKDTKFTAICIDENGDYDPVEFYSFPERTQFLGEMFFVDDSVICEVSTQSPVVSNLFTNFYDGYSMLQRENLKSIIRNKKLNSILK
jgi:hypothetical protein